MIEPLISQKKSTVWINGKEIQILTISLTGGSTALGDLVFNILLPIWSVAAVNFGTLVAIPLGKDIDGFGGTSVGRNE